MILMVRQGLARSTETSVLIDWLKTRAPFWKKESFAGGGDAWVQANEADDEAAAKWATVT